MKPVNSVVHSLLVSKTSPPSTAIHQVPRAAISGLIRAPSSAKLILMRAPAGFGKTTTMAQCHGEMQKNAVACAWISIEAADNDPEHFLQCMAAAVAALAQVTPDREAAGPGHVRTDGVAAIVEGLQGVGRPFAIFLDDFQHVRARAVLDLAGALIDQLPAGGTIVMGSRTLPDLNIGTLRARGHLIEIDAGHLGFSMAETEDFLSRCRALELSTEELHRLHGKTEGWVTGLWLASLVLERSAARAQCIDQLDGGHDLFSAYFQETVLAALPGPTRDFLLRTSILGTFNASLCSAVLGQPVMDTALRRLCTDGLLLTSVDDRQRYRYHALFASFLSAQLAHELPSRISQLHHAAADWHQRHGDIVASVGHTHAGGDRRKLLQVLSQRAEALLEDGRVLLLTRWFDAIPAQLMRKHPMLQVMHVYAAMLAHGARMAGALLERLSCVGNTDPVAQAHIIALQPMLLLMADRHDEVDAAADQACAVQASLRPFAVSLHVKAMALLHAVFGRHSDALHAIECARLISTGTPSALDEAQFKLIAGIMHAQRGEMRQAAANFCSAFGAARPLSAGLIKGTVWTGIPYAAALYESNELARAEQLLNKLAPQARQAAISPYATIGFALLARIAVQRGDIDHALQLLSELECFGHHERLARVVATAKLERARMLLLHGDIQGAHEELRQVSSENGGQGARTHWLPTHNVECRSLGTLRWLVHAGDADYALVLLRDEMAQAESGLARPLVRHLKLKLLTGIALSRCGRDQDAGSLMAEMLQTAHANGLVRFVLDEGELVVPLIEQVRHAAMGGHAGRRNKTFHEYLGRLLQAQGIVPQSGARPEAEPALHLIESLTSKESRILSLVAQGHSNGDLAATLFVSDSTIRTHLRNLNAKLGAKNRTQAVAIAGKMGLIPRPFEGAG